MKVEQLDLFETPKSEMNVLWETLIELKESHRKVQKRLFGELSELKNRLIENQAELERVKIQSNIAIPKLVMWSD